MGRDNSQRRFYQLVAFLLIIILSACFHGVNHPPTANAGSDILAFIGERITLSAALSSDVDGDSLRYTWAISSIPDGSDALLSSPNSSSPSIAVDLVGNYILKLVVSDGEKKSKADFVTIFVSNEAPVAVITETSIRTGSHYVIGDTVNIDASQSSDPENQNIFYSWEMTVKPSGSNALLTAPTGIYQSFTVDEPGHYIVHLVVNDGFKSSAPQMIIFEIESPARKTDTRPFAEAGNDQTFHAANTIITLDGSASYDLENDPLTYDWEMIYKPKTSFANLLYTNGAFPQFTADVLGHYVVRLQVNDLNGASHIDTVVITPHESAGLFCSNCHTKPEDHFTVYDDCKECHGRADWQSIGEISHAHGQIARPAQCEICHNGSDAKGKPTSHITTDKDCNYCHLKNIGPWKPASNIPVELDYEHRGIVGNCILCHDDEFQRAKPVGHMPVSDRCLACHSTEQWSSEVHLEHTGIFQQCIDCHNGTKAKGKIPGHLSTNENCDSCHEKTQWKMKKEQKLIFDHAKIFQPCISCHNNAPNNAGWKSRLHLGSTNNCGACHSTGQFQPVIAVDTTEIIGHLESLVECSKCHTQESGHMPTTKRCEACHSLVSFKSVVSVDHNEEVGECFFCHNNEIVTGKRNSTHLKTTNYCDACHLSIGWNYLTSIDHNEVYGDCDSCHDGRNSSGRNPAHITTSSECGLCHGDVNWVPSLRVSHSQVIGRCSKCHDGAIFSDVPFDHAPIIEDCGSSGCHSTIQWKVQKPDDHNSNLSNCFSCHNNIAATGKPKERIPFTGEFEKHIPSADSCESCHSNLYWKPLDQVDHDFVDGGPCEKCHNGALARGKNGDHIKVKPGGCDACHTTNQFIPAARIDHSMYDGDCLKCHNGIIASGQSFSHISATRKCEACHNYLTFVPFVVDHNEVVGACADCHVKSPGHIASLPVGGYSIRECELCHVDDNWLTIKENYAHFNGFQLCSECHQPPHTHLMNQVVSNCESCHIVASWKYPAREL